MIALGYIERPDKDSHKAVEKTVRELRYNLGEAYQDDSRYPEAHEIFESLYAADRDEQSYTDLIDRVAPAPVARVPLLNSDVHDLEGLGTIADALFGGERPVATAGPAGSGWPAEPPRQAG